MRYFYSVSSYFEKFLCDLSNKSEYTKLTTCLQCGHKCHWSYCSSPNKAIFDHSVTPCWCNNCFCISCISDKVPEESYLCCWTTKKSNIINYITGYAIPYKNDGSCRRVLLKYFPKLYSNN